MRDQWRGVEQRRNWGTCSTSEGSFGWNEAFSDEESIQMEVAAHFLSSSGFLQEKVLMSQCGVVNTKCAKGLCTPYIWYPTIHDPSLQVSTYYWVCTRYFPWLGMRWRTVIQQNARTNTFGWPLGRRQGPQAAARRLPVVWILGLLSYRNV